MNQEEIAGWIGLYIVGMWISWMVQDIDCDVRGYRIFFWPVSFGKYLLKSFIKAILD